MRTTGIILLILLAINGVSQINAAELLRKNRVHTLTISEVSSSKYVPSETLAVVDSMGFIVRQIQVQEKDSTISVYEYDGAHRLISERDRSNYGYSYEYNRIDSNTYSERMVIKGEVYPKTVTIQVKKGKRLTYVDGHLKKTYACRKRKESVRCKVVHYDQNGHRCRVSKERHYYNKEEQKYRFTAQVRKTLFFADAAIKKQKRYRVETHYFYNPDGLLNRITDYHSFDKSTTTTTYRYLKRE